LFPARVVPTGVDHDDAYLPVRDAASERWDVSVSALANFGVMVGKPGPNGALASSDPFQEFDELVLLLATEVQRELRVVVVDDVEQRRKSAVVIEATLLM
jgi:hypothetical protein